MQGRIVAALIGAFVWTACATSVDSNPGDEPTPQADASGAPTPQADASDEPSPPPPSSDDGSADAIQVTIDDAAFGSDVDTTPTGPVDYGGVGQLVLVPLQYTTQPVPPIIAAECMGDPTAGFTEYKDSFVVQRPYDLAAADRFSYANGIYTIWVLSSDKPHAMGNGTAPRTEVRYSDMKSGEHIWTGDFMVESPSEDVCIFQVKGALGAIGVYLRVNAGSLHQLNGADFMSGIYGNWYNLKVYWNSATGLGNVYINNCLKATIHGQGNSIFYFKHGTYTCKSSICKDHYKNIHLYQRGSSDVYNVKSPIP